MSDFIPIKHIVDGIRELFKGDLWTPVTFWAVIWTLILVVAGLWIGTRTFRRQNAWSRFGGAKRLRRRWL